MRRFTRYVVVIGVGMWLVAPRVADAQQRTTGTTSSGMFGQRSVGSASGLTGGQRSFAGGGNQQTLGQSQQFGGGQGVLNRTLQNSSTGQLTGRFVRDSRGAGQFVGSDASDVNSALLGGGQGNRALQGLQQNLRGNNAQNRNRQPNQQQGQQGQSRSIRQTPFRVTRSPTFTYQPSATTPVLNERLTGLIQNSTRIQLRSPVEVVLQGRTAVLRGEVATDSDRDLAARLVLLAPGVYQVENQLTVASDAPASSPPED